MPCDVLRKNKKDIMLEAPPSLPEQPTQDQVHNSLRMAMDTMLKWELASSQSSKKKRIWDCLSKDASSAYLVAVDKLQDLMGSLSVSQQGQDPAFDHAQSLLQLAMMNLEDEFRHLLVSWSSTVDPEWAFELVSAPPSRGEEDSATDAASGSSREGDESEERDDASIVSTHQPGVPGLHFTIDLLPADVVSDLNHIAQRMIAGGYGRECCHAYATLRKAVLEQNLYRLGVEKLRLEDVHKLAWESLEVRIRKWVQTLKVAVRVLCASERLLCDQVFHELSPWRETSLVELARGPMMQLLSLGESIAIGRRSPEKLFRILDMYEALTDLLPDINTIFSDDLCVSIRSEANGILVRLGEAARGTFAEFENAIQRDASKIPVPGGAVHPLTRYVMNYIWFLNCYASTLRRLLGEKKLPMPRIDGAATWDHRRASDQDEVADRLSPLAVQIIWLTVLLECNLDGKSKLYKDTAQAYLFLMNNSNYIVQKVKQSELASLVGEDWIRKHSGQVQQYATNCVRASWNKVLVCLRDEGLTGGTGPFSLGSSKKVVLKERFKTFNAAFEEALRTQSAWVVPDPELRGELKLSVADKLVPAYRSFTARYQSCLEAGYGSKYIKFSPQDLDRLLLDLFEGSSTTFAVSDQRKSFSVASLR